MAILLSPSIRTATRLFLLLNCRHPLARPVPQVTASAFVSPVFFIKPYTTSRASLMPRGVKKEHLPEKVCTVCHRPFTWRKKWEKVWDEVQTCSKSCQAQRRKMLRAQNRLERQIGGSFDGSISDTCDKQDMGMDDPRSARKLAKKQAKAVKRAKRQGTIVTGQKTCTVCSKNCDLLIRCQINASQSWHMVCGTCWKDVSGGVVDGDADHPHYKYGGLWKNRAQH